MEGMLAREGSVSARDDDELATERRPPKTPHWWTVGPTTPAEAPQAKRRKAARSRGTTALIGSAAIAFSVFAGMLLARIGRQVQAVEPVRRAATQGVKLEILPAPPLLQASVVAPAVSADAGAPPRRR
jgi:hypothetical protein